MSRIGKKPVIIPADVIINVDNSVVSVKGPRGELRFTVPKGIEISAEGKQIVCQPTKTTKKSSALWGTTRARIANLVTGVTKGFQKQLELQGIGYRAVLKGKNLEMTLGFSHPVEIVAPEGITFEVAKEIITVTGTDKVLVGQIAANIRACRPPEPYKGKGVRYVGEHVRHKVGKVVGATTE